MAVYSAGQIALVARGAGFSGNALVTAVAVALAESSGRTDVVNSLGCVGLWQVNQPVHVKDHPAWSVSYLQDPSHNAQAAYTLSSGGTNWKPWETYTNGMYKDHLAEASRAVGASGSAGGVANATPAGWLTDLPGEALGGASVGASALGDAAGSVIPEPITAAFDAVTNPQIWMRAAYLFVGGALIIGGLLVVAKPVLAKSTAAASKVAAAAAV